MKLAASGARPLSPGSLFAQLDGHTRLWSARVTIRIAHPDADAWSFRAEEAEQGEGAAIEALGSLRIISDLSLQRIDLLKINIEGGEYEVFSNGVEDWIDQVGTIEVERHDRCHPGCTEAVRRPCMRRKPL